MKKMSMICAIALGLAGAALPSKFPFGEPIFLRFDEDKVTRLKEGFKEEGGLKRYLDGLLLTNHVAMYEEVPLLFMQKFGVSGEALQAALMEIIRESAALVGWDGETRLDEPEDTRYPKIRQGCAVLWLGACADAEAKKFLLGIATGKSTRCREAAAESYLRRADAQEVRDAFARLLFDEGLNLYEAIRQVYDEAEGDTQKREAIVASVAAALEREESKNLFAKADKDFAIRSKEYAESPQRKAMRKRMDMGD